MSLHETNLDSKSTRLVNDDQLLVLQQSNRIPLLDLLEEFALIIGAHSSTPDSYDNLPCVG